MLGSPFSEALHPQSDRWNGKQQLANVLTESLSFAECENFLDAGLGRECAPPPGDLKRESGSDSDLFHSPSEDVDSIVFSKVRRASRVAPGGPPPAPLRSLPAQCRVPQRRGRQVPGLRTGLGRCFLQPRGQSWK